MSGSCSSCSNVDPAFPGVAEEGFNWTDLGQETPGDSKLGPEPLLHLHQRTGKAGWLLCSPASSVLLLFFPYPFSLFLFSGQKQFGPFFLSNFFFFFNYVQSSHAAEIFFPCWLGCHSIQRPFFPCCPWKCG